MAFPEISGGDLCSAGFSLLIVLWFGSWLTGGKDALRRLGVLLAAIAFLAVCGWGVHERQPTTADEVLPIVLTAVVLAGATLGFAWIGFFIVATVYSATLGSFFKAVRRWNENARRDYHAYCSRQEAIEDGWRKDQKAKEVKDKADAEAKTWADEEPKRRQESVEKAKQTYEHKLRVLEAAGLNTFELGAAKEHAKQEYLKELDRVIK